MSVADRIKSLVGAMTIEEFATALDERPQRLKDVFRGKQRVPEDLLVKVVERFHCDANWLLLGIKQSGTPVLLAEQERAGYVVEVLSNEEQALLDNYRNSPPAGRDAIKATSAALAQSCSTTRRRAG